MHKARHILVAIAVMIGMLMPAAALAQDGAPPRRGLAAVDDEGVTVTVRNGEQTSGTVGVVVYLNKSSLARAGEHMTPAQRARYAASVSALQNKVAAEIEVLGGAVVGRFETLSSGLAVSIDAAKIGDLRDVRGVVTVRKAIDYQLEPSETVPWIGAADVQALGVDGEGVDVAVIDTGADYTHLKLGGPGRAEDYVDAYCGPSFDPTVDGPVNPTNPACAAHAAEDMTGLFPGSKIVGGYDWLGDLWPVGSTAISPDPNPIDFHGHGTHVADIIAGLPGGGIGPGVAPGANLWTFKACSSLSSACNGLSVLLAIDDAADLDDDPKTIDPADVINLSLGAIYGQPEDDLTAFANEATLIGAIVVAGAGNSGDKPFIVAPPSTASGAIGVAWMSAPTEKLVRVDTSTADAHGRWQTWSAPQTATVSGTLFYDTISDFTRRGCIHDALGNHLGSPWTPGQHAGRVLFMDRGGCAVSHKVSNAAAAGAVLAIIANNVPQAPHEPPPDFIFGGGTPSIPGYTITLADGDALKATALGDLATVDPAIAISLQDSLVSASSRGPRNNDNAIKPDIAAPGTSVSARVGTGSSTTAFGGTSGASATVAGAAALLKQKYDGLELPAPIAADPSASLRAGLGGEMPVYMYKALLMNTASTEVYLGVRDFGAPLAPITLIGGGRLDVAGALDAQTIAWDETDRPIDSRFLTGDDDCGDGEDSDETNCPIDPRFRTGSMSFGYQTITRREVAVRRGVVANLSDEGRWYDLSASFRYAEDENRGVSLKVYPKRLYVPAGSHRAFFVKMRIDAETLRDWPFLTLDAMDKGFNGSNGSALTRQEYDGYIHIDGGERNIVHLAWHILPKRVASIRPRRHTLAFGQHVTRTLTLHNSARFQDGDVDVFSLVDLNPNTYFYTVLDDIGFIDECTSGPPLSRGHPGPGCNETPIDIKEVGVRDLSDTYIEFGVTIWDSPYRSSQVPVEFDIFVDSNLDGNNDWVVLNYPFNSNLSDGRNVVWVCKPDFTDCTIPFFVDSGFNTQNWILAVPAVAIGVAPGQQFNFQVQARDFYFTGEYTDVSPAGGVSYHTYTMGQPRYTVDNLLPVVPAEGETLLTVARSAGGDAASPSQIGLLLMYRQAPVERESDSVLIKP